MSEFLSTTNCDSTAVVIVDPFSTGAALAEELQNKGFKIVIVYSSGLDKLEGLLGMVPEGLSLRPIASIFFEPNIDDMISKINDVGYPVAAIIAGTETGVELADQLSERLGLRTNGTEYSEARRNKYLMGETIRNAGLRAVRQKIVNSWEEANSFIESWQPNPFEVIVKPLESAGCEDVTLCRSIEEVQEAYEHIMGKVNGLGLTNQSVLIQEYLDGPEYIVDIVSRDGVHKVVQIFVYHRKVINGASFVMFGIEILSIEDTHCKEVTEYQKKVITALGIKNGPTHGEVKFCRGEPVLIEVGSRCHGMEGVWVPAVRQVYGMDQVQATIAAYFDAAAFDSLPAEVKLPHIYSSLLYILYLLIFILNISSAMYCNIITRK